MTFNPKPICYAATSLAWVATTVACGGAGPEFATVDDQIAQVGVQFELELRATDPDGDPIDYSFRADVPDIGDRAQITRSPTGYGLFQWTPLASDVQEWYFDFTASDGSGSDTVTVRIDVRSAVGDATAPVFRRPLGTGTTLDLSQSECLDLDIVVEDQDTAQVTIAQEEPAIEGAELDQSAGLSANWHWCPTRAQADAEDRYSLILSADDASNPKTMKNYLVVLRGKNPGNCPGEAPVITHTATSQNTVVDLTIDADISDDRGLKQAPLFYYSETNPGSNPDLGSMTQTSMLLISGTMSSGTWAADVPNPASPGSSMTLYYVIVADDDDDEMGNCDHVTESQVYSMSVTNPGGAGNTGLCESCSNDAQCGNDGDLCVNVAATQQSYCLAACDGPGDCPSGYTCSAGNVTSVDGASARQCVPNTGSCTMTAVCVDDSYEDNDSRTQANANPALPPDLYELTSCPDSGGFADDEDWFKISITQSSRVNVTLYGDDASDLDLGLYDDAGVRISSSTSLQSDEMLTKCVPTGTYFIRAYAWGAAENDYLLEWTRANETCDTTCQDDVFEDDDTYSQARSAYDGYTAGNNQICTNDDDHYRINLTTGDVLTVDLTFTQSNFQQDLDLHLLDEFGFDLTPCSEAEPWTCTAAQGQSADSNEQLVYTIPAGCSAGCDYYVVVHGWDGSTNSYSIAMSVQ
jgi:hypothetical protein